MTFFRIKEVSMDIQQETKICTLSALVERQGQQIAELQKQLADMQKATSCELDSAIQNVLLQGVENGAKKAKELIKNQDFYQKTKQTSR